MPRLSGRSAIVLVAACSIALAPHLVEARAGLGSSFGSRGYRTYSPPPPTATAPYSSPLARSMTPQQTSPSTSAPYAPRSYYGYGYGGGFMSGLFGGMLGAGIGGLLFGHGFFGGITGFGSLLGLLLQLAVIYFLVRLAFGFFRTRYRPYASSGRSVIDVSYSTVPERPVERLSYAAPAGGGSLNLAAGDFDAFEQLLRQIQADWSRGDLASLRRHVTPEMLSYFAELLAANTSRGVENHVAEVKLEQGDLAEAWTEGGVDYATVAMRFSLLDWTIDQATGRVVQGDPALLTQAREIWTFMRAHGGNWLLSAIQQAG